MNLFEGRLNRDGAQPPPEARVYYCVVCGPCVKHLQEGVYVTVHRNIPHASAMWFDEEERPQ